MGPEGGACGGDLSHHVPPHALAYEHPMATPASQNGTTLPVVFLKEHYEMFPFCTSGNGWPGRDLDSTFPLEVRVLQRGAQMKRNGGPPSQQGEEARGSGERCCRRALRADLRGLQDSWATPYSSGCECDRGGQAGLGHGPLWAPVYPRLQG